MSRDEDIIDALAELARDAALEAESRHPADGGRARFIERVAHKRETRSYRGWALVALVFCVLALGITSTSLLWTSKNVVVFTVEGAKASNEGFVQAPADGWAVVRFSDKSSLTLAPGSVGRVHGEKETGARFSLERGTLAVHVAKRSGGADYVVEAGPYAVRVTGTKFDVVWDPNEERMQIVMHEGAVVVSGPFAETGVGVSAGQFLVVSAKRGLHIGDGDSLPAVVSSSADSPSTSMATGSVPVPQPSSVASQEARETGDRHLSWAERVATGDFEGVIAEAESRGVGETMQEAPLGDLMALADAARYGGRAALATQALQSVRKRFAGTKAASTSAFLLGRMAEDAGKTETALSLYDATIAEGSTFGGEALGRKMLLLKKSKGGPAAQGVAVEYLKRYPRGPYADAARSLVAP